MSVVTLQVAQRGVLTLPKAWRDRYRIQAGDTFTLVDLDGVFILAPKHTQVEALAERLATELNAAGESLETMLQALREERASYED